VISTGCSGNGKSEKNHAERELFSTEFCLTIIVTLKKCPTIEAG
jgi:hypothetical protein